MQKGTPVTQYAYKVALEQILASAASGVVISLAVEGGEGLGSIESMAQQIITVGGPIALGAAVAGVVYPPELHQTGALERYLKRGVVAGGVATAVAMYAGLMPALLDLQTVSFVAVVAGSVYLGDTIVEQLN